ncbi:MAG TPA: hypothetical protein VER14_02865 [Phototrophicaceae bacterium]|nr:hypothetical protein [Phototrophicaceae bacterium]
MRIKNNTKRTARSVLSVAAILVILIQVTMMDTAQGLTKYYNCVTRDANNHGTLSLADVEDCYEQVFNGADNADDDGRPLS